MALAMTKQAKKQDFGRIEDGTYQARVAQVIDLGIQHNTVWLNGASQPEYYVVDENGKTQKGSDGYAKKTTTDTGHPVLMPKVQVTFEFPTERIEINGESKPRWQSKEYNVTSSGALAKLVEALAPGSANIGDILGKACTVAIGSTSGKKAKISSVSPPMKGMQVGELENPATVFDFDNPDKTTWDNMLGWVKDKIKASPNYEGSALQRMVDGGEAPAAPAGNFDDFDDDIPF